MRRCGQSPVGGCLESRESGERRQSSEVRMKDFHRNVRELPLMVSLAKVLNAIHTICVNLVYPTLRVLLRSTGRLAPTSVVKNPKSTFLQEVY